MSGVDWPGLLKWSMQYQDNLSETNLEEYRSRPREDYQWLEQVIQSVLGSIRDLHKAVEEAAPKLRSDDPNDVLAALRIISRGIEDDPEMARQLDRLGAIPDLTACVNRKELGIRDAVALVLSEALPNNVTIQKKFWEAGLLERVLECLESHLDDTFSCPPPDEETAEVIAYARIYQVLASLVKNSTSEIQDEFLSRGGEQLTRRILQRATHESYKRVTNKCNAMLEYLRTS